MGCNSLASIHIPDSVTSIGYGAFFGCPEVLPLLEIIPDRLWAAGALMGWGGLKEIILPESVTAIESSAFKNCSNLDRVTFLGPIKNIDDRAFLGCGRLSSIWLSAPVEMIGVEVFSGCPGEFADTIDLLFPAIENRFESDRSIEFKQQVVLDYAKISPTGKNRITTYIKANRHLFAEYWLRDPNERSTFIRHIGSLVVSDNIERLRDLSIKLEATAVTAALLEMSKAFREKSEADPSKEFDLDNNLTKEDVDALWSIAIRSGGAYVVEAYLGAEKIVTFPFEYGENRIRRTGSNCNLRSIEELTIPEGWSRLKPLEAPNLRTVFLPSTMNQLQSRAFENCKKLEKVTLSEAITEIKERAFEGCSNLITINLPGSLKKIDPSAFAGCKNLSASVLSEIQKLY
jgi:hypothetical protein